MKKIIDIRNKYSLEIGRIQNKLAQLEKERVYEPRLGKHSKMDGTLNTNVNQLKEMLTDLLNKIEYDKQSDEEKLGESLRKHKV